MRWPIVFTIVRKELTETLRDRRTIVMMLGLPVVLYPLIMIGLSGLQQAQRSALEAQPSRVAVWGPLPVPLRQRLEDATDLTLVEPPACSAVACPPDLIDHLRGGTMTVRGGPVPAAGEGQPEADPLISASRHPLREGIVDAVIVADIDAGLALTEGRDAAVLVLHDETRPESSQARHRISVALDRARGELLRERETAAGVPEGFSRLLTVTERGVAGLQRRAGRALGLFIPFLLISLSLVGGLYPAIDATAGEKERGTMQTLLCAPLRPVEIIAGKFLAVWTIALVAGVVNLLSLSTTVLRVLPGDAATVQISTLAFTLAMLAPVTFTATATFLAVAALAKDFKDGQNFLTPVYTLVLVPSAVTMLPTASLSPWTAFVPIVNVALLIKDVLSGTTRAELVLLVVVSSLLYAGLAMSFAARVFAQEQVLLGGRLPWRALFGFERRADRRPTPSIAFGLFAASMVLQFYGSLWFTGLGLPLTLVVLQVGFLLVPTAVVLRTFDLDVRHTLRLSRPHPLAWLGACLVGASAWLVASGVFLRLAPPPEGLTRELQRALMLDDASMGLGALLVLVAVLPAFCEELLFRGVVLSGLARAGARAAIGGSALMFAVAHPSVYRLLPTLFLGGLLGYLAWRSGSIVTSITAHAINNAFIIVLARRPELAAWLGWTSAEAPPPLNVTLGALIVVMLGLLLSAVAPTRRRGDLP